LNDLVLITPPVGEPVCVDDMYLQLGMVKPTDDALSTAYATKLNRAISAARRMCDTYTRSVFLAQTWLLKLDGFPCVDMRYHRHHRHEILLPKLPFQSIQSMQYVDETGTVQPLTQDTSFGTNPSEPAYGFQLDPGSETNPARLMPPWAKPWPPTRRVASSVMIQFKCGFGGPLTGATIAQGAAIVQGLTFLPGDVGQPVTLPSAGVGGIGLATSILSVDGNGQATLATSVTSAIAPATKIWVGKQIPETINQAILLQAEFLFTQGGDMDVPLPRVVTALLDEHRNLVA
jgi:hypothetical protein